MPNNIEKLHAEIKNGSFSALARGITMVENELKGYDDLLLSLNETSKPQVVGITGPPGAGKSTLVNALLGFWLIQKKKIGVLVVDPSSPFNYGALLGDRIRMKEYYTNPNIFIRSLATRGELGGLSSKIIEITDLVKEAKFDIVIVETVGVGQSEVEIAGLADCTVVLLVPEAGDEVQTLKAGIMEIADIFVVNKAERADAELLYRNLKMLVHEKAINGEEIPVFKTIASENTGIDVLGNEIIMFLNSKKEQPEKRFQLLAEKSRQIIQKQRMKQINLNIFNNELKQVFNKPNFNLYEFVYKFLKANNFNI